MEPSRPKPSMRERLNISRLAIQFPRFTIATWIAISIAGLLALSSLKFALFPDITFPVVVVTASTPLKTAVDTEKQVTIPLEQALNGLEPVTGVSSTTYPGQSVINARFEVGTNLETAVEQVEASLKPLKLPTNTTTKIVPVNLNEAAVVSYAVESKNLLLPQITPTVRQEVIPEIAEVPGVYKVNLLGDNEAIDLTKLKNPREAIAQAGSAVRFDGKDALAIQVVKQGSANTLEVVRQVEKKVEELRTRFPDLQMTQAVTQATYIEAATNETVKALIEAIAIAVIVIFPFLWNWKATAISALAIPTCLLATFIVMAFSGFNLETITLLALGMIVGSLVDDAIVDVENIMRHLDQGEPPKQAVTTATDEIGLTVIATSLTVVAVFLPVGLMGGVLGQFFKPFGITISAAMIASMLVARTLSPVLSVYWLRANNRATTQQPPTQNWMDRLNQAYYNLLNWSLNHRWLVIGLSLLTFAAGLALIPLIPKGFIPKLDRGEFNVTYVAPAPQIPREFLAAQAAAQQGGARQVQGEPPNPGDRLSAPPIPPFNPLSSALKAAQDIDNYLLDQPDVANVFTVIGARQGEPNRGISYVQLKQDRSAITAAIQDRIRAGMPAIAGVTTSVEDIQFVDTGGEKPVQVKIAGEDLQQLNKAANAIATRLKTIPGLVDVAASVPSQAGATVTEIQRDDGERIATISANLGQGLTIGEASDRATAEAQAVLPAGVSLKLGGDSARVNDILRSFGSTLALSVVCIFLVLLALFRNWIDTLVIFLSLPLSIVGAMVGLLIARSDFGMISLLGIIFLLGLTSKNAILIVDYIKQMRQQTPTRRAAILEAVPTRLRPILMTTFSTIFGMLPLALALGAGAELRAPMAISIMGGLVTSSLLSLLVVPVLYDLLDDWQTRWRNRKAKA